MKQIRSFNFEIKAENNEQYGDFITGRAIVFDEWADLGLFDEKISREALNETDLKDVRFLVNHNTNMIPLARSRNNNANSTMQLAVDSEGLVIRANLDTENNAEARALYSATKRGDISGMSFMLTVDGEEWDDLKSEKAKRTITKIGKVFEVSAVTFPTYEATTLEARGNAEALESAKAALESAKAKAERDEAINKINETLKGL